VVPVRVEVVCITGLHSFEVVVAVEMRVSKFFLDNFPAPVVEHTFVARLLHSSRRVFVQLLSVHQSVPLSESSMGFSLVNFVDRLSIFVHFCLLFESFLDELALTERVCPLHFPHLTLHLIHHLISPTEHVRSETVAEKGIVFENTSSIALHHLCMHIFKLPKNVALPGKHIVVGLKANGPVVGGSSFLSYVSVDH